MPSTGSVELNYRNEEPVPNPIECNIHPWMRGYLLLRSTPYMAKTDINGDFTIKNLPVGEHVFRLWHERCGYLKNVTFGPIQSDAKGRLKVSISEGKNTLADAELPSNRFERED